MAESGRSTTLSTRYSLSVSVGEEIECPWRASQFNIKAGRVTMDPATEDVATYRVRLLGDAVEVEI